MNVCEHEFILSIRASDISFLFSCKYLLQCLLSVIILNLNRASKAKAIYEMDFFFSFSEVGF